MLVYFKADIIIISSNVTCSRYDIANIFHLALNNHSLFKVTATILNIGQDQLLDMILKGDNPRTISAQFTLFNQVDGFIVDLQQFFFLKISLTCIFLEKFGEKHKCINKPVAYMYVLPFFKINLLFKFQLIWIRLMVVMAAIMKGGGGVTHNFELKWTN